MSSVGIFGLLLGLLGATFAFVTPTRTRITVFCGCYLLHVAASLAYYQLVKNGGGDALFYYEDPARIYDDVGFGFNTAFIIYIVQLPKSVFGGSFFDYFLVFQAVGFWGLALLMRTFEEIFEEVGVAQPAAVYLLLFLPSLHYWTGAVGKDGLFFFAICAALSASMNVKKRYLLLFIAMAIMLVIRSYIAMILLTAFALNVLIDRKTSVAIRIPLFVMCLGATAYAVGDVAATFKVDLTNVDTITGMFESRDAMFEQDFVGNTAVNSAYPIRVLSLLFRPFFFDAPGPQGFIVSLENVLQVIATVYALAHFRTLRKIAAGVPFARYALVSTAGIVLALSIGYYNVGLGIRQEATMILPGLLVLLVSIWAVRAAMHVPRGIERTASRPAETPGTTVPARIRG